MERETNEPSFDEPAPGRGHSYETRVVYEPEEIQADIIFVHGLNGHPDKTWRHMGSKRARYGVHGCFWPRHLLPKSVPNCRMISAGYDSSLSSKDDSHSLASLARYVATDIRRMRINDETSSKAIIFIAHSTGGLIVKSILAQELLENHPSARNSILSNTRLIIFLGTPHRGLNVLKTLGPYHWMATGLRFTSGLPYRKQLEEESEALDELSAAFSKVLKHTHIDIVSCYETVPTKTLPAPYGYELLIVPKGEAVIGLPDETPFPVDKIHRELSMMTGFDDSHYMCLAALITSAVAPSTAATPPPGTAEVESTTEPPKIPEFNTSLPPPGLSHDEQRDPSVSPPVSLESTLVPTSVEMVMGINIVPVEALIDLEATADLISRRFLLDHGIVVGDPGGRDNLYKLYFRDKMTRMLQHRSFEVTDDLKSHEFPVIFAVSASSVAAEGGTSVQPSPTYSPSSTGTSLAAVPTVDGDLLGISPFRLSTEGLENTLVSTEYYQGRQGSADMLPSYAESLLHAETNADIDIAATLRRPSQLTDTTLGIMSQLGSRAVGAAEEAVEQTSSATTVIAGIGAGVAGVTVATQIYNANTARKALLESRRSADVATTALEYSIRKDTLALRKKKKIKAKSKVKADTSPQARNVPPKDDPDGDTDDDMDGDTDDGADGNAGYYTNSSGWAIPETSTPAPFVPRPSHQASSPVQATSSKSRESTQSALPIPPVITSAYSIPRMNTQRHKSSYEDGLLDALTTLPSPPTHDLPVSSAKSIFTLSHAAFVPRKAEVGGGLHSEIELQELRDLPSPPRTDPSSPRDRPDGGPKYGPLIPTRREVKARANVSVPVRPVVRQPPSLATAVERAPTTVPAALAVKVSRLQPDTRR